MFDLIPFSRSDRSLFNLFDEFEKNFFTDFSGLNKQVSSFRTDILDKGDNFVLQAELPGVDKGNIKIDVQDDIMTISASYDEKTENEEKNFVRKERRYGSFTRRFNVSDINTDNILAEYKDGVLEIILPKKEPEKIEPKSIEIK